MRRLSDLARLAARTGGGLLPVLVLAAAAAAQAPATAPPQGQAPDAAPALVPQAKAAVPPVVPADPEGSPLARFIPAQDLALYFEFNGLDNHEAWKNTAAHRLLTETSLGALLEDLGGQALDRLMAGSASRKITGAEGVAAIKHLARRGFAFGVQARQADEEPYGVALVIRGGNAKEVRNLFGRIVAMTMAPGEKARLEKKGSRTLVAAADGSNAITAAWWGEKDELIYAVQKRGDTAQAIIDCIEEKQPGAVAHPIRNELARSDADLQPIGIGFFDLASSVRFDADAAKLGLEGLKRVDVRWGVSGESMVTVTRLVAPAPRQGILAMLDDQPTFDRDALPPLPAGLKDFTVLALAPAKAYDAAAALARSISPEFGARIDAFEQGVKDKTRQSLRDDLLARLGPTMAFYAMQGKVTPAEGGGGNPLAALTSALTTPRYVLLAEVDDPTAFGKALDAMMLHVNQVLREQAENAVPEGEAAKDATKKAARGSSNAPRFQLAPGSSAQSKAYSLTIPAGGGGVAGLPNNLRPTIRLSGKYLAVALSPDVARMALEIKPAEALKPDGELAEALERVPGRVGMLMVEDQRESLPPALTALPSTMRMLTMIADPPAAGAAAGGPGRPGTPGAGPASGGIRGGPPGGSSAGYAGVDGPEGGRGGPPPGYGSGGYPGSSAAMAGSGGAPGQPGAAPAAPPAELKVDPSKIPQESELKSRLFPSTTSVVVDDQGLRVVRRHAFVDVPSPATMLMVMPALQNGVAAARRAAGLPEAPAQPAAESAPGAAPGAPGGYPGGPRGYPGGGPGGSARPPGYEGGGPGGSARPPGAPGAPGGLGVSSPESP